MRMVYAWITYLEVLQLDCTCNAYRLRIYYAFDTDGKTLFKRITYKLRTHYVFGFGKNLFKERMRIDYAQTAYWKELMP